jgi:ABC-type Na+ efflux pump permease subunit
MMPNIRVCCAWRTVAACKDARIPAEATAPPASGVFFVAVFAVAPDTFAGERERHTLETLLASRLSDQAILIGKLAACTSYGWLLTIITIVVGVITINAANWSGHVLFYRSATSWLGIILLPKPGLSDPAARSISVDLSPAAAPEFP